MISYLRTSIFDSDAEVLVNPVNQVGVMGKGLAEEFKFKYPEMHGYYRALCKNHLMEIPQLFEHTLRPGRKILLFPTKTHWKLPSDKILIAKGLAYFVEMYEFWEIKSISFPKLGCGLGRLDWESDVKPLMIKYLGDLHLQCIIHI